MVMKRKKITLGILIGVLFIGAVVFGVFHLIDREEDDMAEVNGGDEMVLPEDDATPLTEEQSQFLRDSISDSDYMSNVSRRNAWLILDAMAEIEFVENRYPGESGVGVVTLILGLLGVGEIEELTIVRVWQQNIDDLAASLTIRIVNMEGRVYYVWYNQTWGLEAITKESENGEILYDRELHRLTERGICHRFDDPDCR